MSRLRVGSGLLLAGGLLLALSTVVPWATVHSANDQITVYGVHTAALGLHVSLPGLALALLGFLAWRRGAFLWKKITSLVLALLTAGWIAALVAALDDISKNAAATTNSVVTVDRGIGVWGIILGAVLAVIGGIVLAVAPRARAAGSSPRALSPAPPPQSYPAAPPGSPPASAP